MKKILHITTHMGGGVGKVLADTTIFEKENESIYGHKVILLSNPINTYFVDKAENAGIEILISPKIHEIQREVENADIVVLHWWHHPVMAELLNEISGIRCKLIVWIHISGCTYPNVPIDFMRIPHFVLFTTPYSFDNPLWTDEEKKYVKTKGRVVYGLGELKNFRTKGKRINNNFNIGYVGTQDFNKIHPDFIKYCTAASDAVPEAHFIMVGETNPILVKQVNESNISNKFEFKGYINDVAGEFLNFDIFGYLLNPYHFGATENALLEAMNAGLPVVTLNQLTEKYILTNNNTGIMINSPEEYAKTIKFLKENEEERIRLGDNAKKYIEKEYRLYDNIYKLREVLNMVDTWDKKEMNFRNVFGNEAYEWFLSCLGKDKELFERSIKNSNDKEIKEKIRNCEEILKGESKSSIKHFARTFSDDEIIKYWERLISDL